MAATRIRIGKQNKKSTTPRSIVYTDLSNEQTYFLPPLGTGDYVLLYKESLTDLSWLSTSALINIYNNDGAITGPRVVSFDNPLTFQFDDGSLDSSLLLTSDLTYNTNDPGVSSGILSITPVLASIAINNIGADTGSGVNVQPNLTRLYAENNTSGDNVMFDITNQTGVIASTYSGFQGLKYFADYSANFTSLSLITKGYLDGVIATLPTDNIYTADGTLAGTRTLTGDGFNLTFAMGSGDYVSNTVLGPDISEIFLQNTLTDDITTQSLSSSGLYQSWENTGTGDSSSYYLDSSGFRFIRLGSVGTQKIEANSSGMIISDDELDKGMEYEFNHATYFATNPRSIPDVGYVQSLLTGLGTVTGTGAATRVAFWSGTSSLSSSINLYWDNVNSRLGIATASPSQTLDVNGNVRFRQGLYDSSNSIGSSGNVLTSTGSATAWSSLSSLSIPTGTGTATRVTFWSGTNTLSSNANLYWDNTNSRLGIGTSSPNSRLTINGNSGGYALWATGNVYQDIAGTYSGSQDFSTIGGTITNTSSNLNLHGIAINWAPSNDGTVTGSNFGSIFVNGGASGVTAGAYTVFQTDTTVSSGNITDYRGLSVQLRHRAPTGTSNRNIFGSRIDVTRTVGTDDAHNYYGAYGKLADFSASGRMNYATAMSFTIEGAKNAFGVSVGTTANKGTSNEQYGISVNQVASGTGVVVSGMYGIDLSQSTGGGAAITTYYGIRNDYTPAATTNYGLYFSGSGWRNFLNGSLALGSSNSTAAQLLVTGAGSTSSTLTMRLRNPSNQTILDVRDDGPAFFYNKVAINGGNIVDNTGNISLGVKFSPGVEKTGIFVTNNFALDSKGALFAGGLYQNSVIAAPYWVNLTQDRVTVNKQTGSGFMYGGVKNPDTASGSSSYGGGGYYVQLQNFSNTQSGLNISYQSHLYQQAIGGVTSTVNEYRGFNSQIQYAVSPCVTVNAYDFYAESFPYVATGTITNRYGLYIDFSNSGITNPWGIYQTQSTTNNYFSGAVGIGLSPISIAKLAIRGAGNTNSTASLSVRNSSNSDLFKINDDGNILVGLGGTTTSRFYVLSGGNTSSTFTATFNNSSYNNALVIRDDGNIGFSTASPTQKLDVNGAARFRGEIYDYANSPGTSGDILTSFGAGAGPIWQSLFTLNIPTGAGTPGQIAYYTSTLGLNSETGSGANAFTWDSTNNRLGVRTSSPAAALEVRGDSLGSGQTLTNAILLYNSTPAAAGAQQASPAIRWRGNGWKTNVTAASQPVDFRAFVLPVQGTSAPSGRLYIGSAINGSFSDGQFVFDSSGTLGIGTTAPTSRLHIDNSILTSAYILGIGALTGSTNVRSIDMIRTTGSGSFDYVQTHSGTGDNCIQLIGNTTGDTFIVFTISGPSVSYTQGVDTSDSNIFKFGVGGTTPSTISSTAFSYDGPNNRIGIGGSPHSGGQKIYLQGSMKIDLGSDATGDVYYRNSSGNFVRLPIGSSGQALKVSSGVPAWGTDLNGIYTGSGSLSGATTVTMGTNQLLFSGSSGAGHTLTADLDPSTQIHLKMLDTSGVNPELTELILTETSVNLGIGNSAIFSTESSYINFAASGTTWNYGGHEILMDSSGMFITEGGSIGIQYVTDYSAGILDNNTSIPDIFTVRQNAVENYEVISSTTSPVNLANHIPDYLIAQGATQATFTFNLPATPANGRIVKLTFSTAVTALTIGAQGGIPILGTAATTAAVGTQLEYKYYSSISAWIRVK